MARSRRSTRTGTAALLALATGCGGPASPTPIPTEGLGTPVPNEGWAHVPEGTPASYRHNPPASGPHYPVWLRYEEYATAVARPYWVHNLEHGAVVFLYRPDAPAEVVRAVTEAYRSLPNDPLCGHKRALLTPDPVLDGPFAIVAADFVLEASAVDTQSALSFATSRRGHGPEQVCAQGTRP